MEHAGETEISLPQFVGSRNHIAGQGVEIGSVARTRYVTKRWRRTAVRSWGHIAAKVSVNCWLSAVWRSWRVHHSCANMCINTCMHICFRVHMCLAYVHISIHICTYAKIQIYAYIQYMHECIRLFIRRWKKDDKNRIRMDSWLHCPVELRHFLPQLPGYYTVIGLMFFFISSHI